MNDLKQRLLALMDRHSGKANAITRRELRRILGVPDNDDRQFRLLIEELRLQGVPILSSANKPAGYYLPENLAELQTGIVQMRSYVISLCKIMRAFRIHGHRYLNGELQRRLL